MKQKLNDNSLQVLNIKEVKKEINETPQGLRLFNRDVKYLKIKDVKRAYSKLIQDYCKGLVTNENAKTITYIFSGYLQLIRDVEFEERLKQLEEKTGDEKL